MSRYLDYLSENQQFQDFLQFGTQEKESYEERRDQGLLGIAQISPIIPDVVKKGKEAYNKSIELYEKGKEAIEKIKQGVKKTTDVLEESTEKLKGVGEKGVKLINDTIDKSSSLAEKVREGINMTKSEIENLTEKYGERFTNEFKDVQEKAVNFGTDLVKQNREKVKALKDAFEKKKQELGRPLNDEELKDLNSQKEAILKERDTFRNRFQEYRDQLQKDLKSKFTEKTQEPSETPKVEPKAKVEPKSEIEPAEEQVMRRKPTQFIRKGEQEDSSFIRRRTQQMSKRVVEEDFERDDMGDIVSREPSVMDRLTSVFRGGTRNKASRYTSEELQNMKDEFDRLSSGARSQMAEARYQELKSNLDKYGSEFKASAEKAGAEAMGTGKTMLKTGETAVKGVAKGLQKTGEELLEGSKETLTKGVQQGKEFLQSTAKGLQTAGRESLEEGSTVAKSAISRGAGLVEEGGQLVRQTASKAVGLASEGGQIASETLSTIGGIVGETVPVLGEVANIGLGLYDIIKSFADKPHIYNEARPVFTAGL